MAGKKKLPYAYCCGGSGSTLEPLLLEAVLRPEFTPRLKKKKEKKNTVLGFLTEGDLSPRLYAIEPTTAQSLGIRQSQSLRA